jgi:signal transduction histidine kinase
MTAVATSDRGGAVATEDARPAPRPVLGAVEDRRETRRRLFMRLVFLVGLLAWTSLAAWWATYFYLSTLDVRNTTLRAYSAEERLEALQLEQKGLTEAQARAELEGTVFTLAPVPLSAEESEYPNEILRGGLKDRAVIVRPAERARLATQLRRKMIMLAGEGSLLVGLLFACLMALYRMLMGELHLRRHQESFVHAVTHELKSPLTGLRSLLQTLSTLDVPKEERRSYLELGVREIDRLDHLVANILLSSRLEAEAFRPNIADVDLAVQLGRLRDNKQHIFQERGGSISLQVPAGLRARADAEALETILENLVDNAIKYAPEHPTVKLSARTSGKRVLIDVADNGIGLSAADLEHVFNKFYRAPTGEQRQAKGTGLGLFIARALARTLGGELSASSEGPGKGTTFTLELPA